MSKGNQKSLNHPDLFVDRHIGPRSADIQSMLRVLGFDTLEQLVGTAIPAAIRLEKPLDLPGPRSEKEVLDDLRALAGKNRLCRSFIGQGYYGTILPPAIQRGILENPGWYTSYTPYQAEISQGRLEALLNFQTLISDLTALPITNASLLDEGTAAAEAMTLCRRTFTGKDSSPVFFVSDRCHPQTIAVVRTRAVPLGIEVVVGDWAAWDFSRPTYGALVQYPDTFGVITDFSGFAAKAHAAGAKLVVAADLLALTLLSAPGEFGADVVVGSAQRFGVPMGFGGPHAGFMATKDEFRRQIPGRIVGLSKDAQGNPALRLALQTREQHIRREKATSNICTAQVLLAVIASMYAVYHGPDGLRAMAQRIQRATGRLREQLRRLGFAVTAGPVFDTLRVVPGPKPADSILADAGKRGINLCRHQDGSVGLSLDETVGSADLQDLFEVFGGQGTVDWDAASAESEAIPASVARTSSFLQHPVFSRYHSETELMRYMKALENRDLSLTVAMIPLGSCTLKLNAAAEMYPITAAELAGLHPFVPAEQSAGSRQLIDELGRWLAEITGFAATSFMPNAGSQGEYTGLQVIRAYHHARGEGQRTVCLIPESAHGTNPASAALSGLDVVVVKCAPDGDIDLDDLKAKAEAHREKLGALMITYPSTHGVFEEGVREICKVIHANGGQVYVDGANMNAMVGLCRPGDFGGDVCHLNLHKTFAIPHGGGGPGVGPICVAAHLAPFLPTHPLLAVGGERAIGPVSAAPFGSASILPIPYAYIAMLGFAGLKRSTEVAILNANYLAKKLDPHYPVVYKGKRGCVAHECIIDLRSFKATAGIEPEDVAKRLMDYGFHAPTMSWPVHGTLMVEPTESESKEELDRFVEAMVMIREEIREIEEGRTDKTNNLLKNSPHTAAAVIADLWDRPYSRERAAFPTAWTRDRKYWPTVGRVDNVFGDKNLVCVCPTTEG